MSYGPEGPVPVMTINFCAEHQASGRQIVALIEAGTTPEQWRLLDVKPLVVELEACRECWKANGACQHPPGQLLVELLCRTCGQWVNGKRVGEWKDGELRRMLERAAERAAEKGSSRS